jgi:hypothetical protein
MSRSGDEAGDIYKTFDLGSDPQYDDVIAAFDDYVTLKKNLVYERHQFFTSKQSVSQSIDSYLLKL